MTEQHARTSLVGRDREMRELVEALNEARLGRGRLILVGGEPGIGKSRLAEELAIRARAQGDRVLWGRGWEDAGAPPFWPWIQALRGYLRMTPPDDLRRHVRSGAADVAQLLPELRELLPDIPAQHTQTSESARFQLFDSTATLLRNAAWDRTTLVVLDDLQAADEPSILLLRFVTSQLNDMPVLVVGTYRNVELTPEHPLTAAIAEVAREPVTGIIALKGLDVEAVGDYIGATSNRKPHDQLVLAVWRATGGNPLFVGEAVRLLSAESRLDDVGDVRALRVAVPVGIRAVIGRRIGHLTDETADILRVSAVIGPEFSVEVLRHVTDAGERAADLVAEAVSAGLLVGVIGAPDRYRFSHDLVRATLYDDLAPLPRARLHQRIADNLEAMYSGSPGPGVHYAELAFHCVEALEPFEAADPVDVGARRRKAVDYARLAADHAARSLAYEEAARLYRMSLSVLDLLDTDEDAIRADTLLALGDVQARVHSLGEARATFLEAADIAKRTSDGRQLARAALGVGGRLAWGRPGKDERLIPLLQDALVLVGDEDDELRVLLLARLACAWRSSPERRTDSDALSRQAIEIARGLDDPATILYALHGRFWATWWPENPEERERLAAEIVAMAMTLGDPERIIDAHLIRFLSLGELGRLSEARVELDALVGAIHHLRQPAQQSLEHVNRAYLVSAVGEFEEADRLIDRQLQGDDYYTPGRDALSAARMQRFIIRREQGRVGEEEATVRASVEDFPWYPFYRAALACLLLDVGRTSEARAVFDGIAKDEFKALYRDNEWLFGMGLTSEACALLGDAEAAAILYRQLEPFAGRHAIAHAEGSVGAVDRYLGLLAATLDDLDRAVHHLDAAVGVNERMGARPWTAHSQHDLAVVLRRRGGAGDDGRADELDQLARRTAIDLDMVLADKIAPRPLDEASAARPILDGTNAAFRREGEYWSIEFGRDAVRVRDSKGMRYLARLLAQPGREIHALDLAASSGRSDPSAAALEVNLATAGLGRADAVLDAEAKAAYRARLAEIGEDLAEAERWNDPGRIARLEDEREALTHELAGALGLGGRDRRAASPAERARVSVTRAIRAALNRIREHSKGLGDHLDATIRTGTFCSYAPDPRVPIRWRT